MNNRKPRKVYFSDAEWALVIEKAWGHGYSSRGKYIREEALGAMRDGPKAIELRALVRIANALLSMSHHYQGSQTRVLAREIREVLKQVLAYIWEKHHAHR